MTEQAAPQQPDDGLVGDSEARDLRTTSVVGRDGCGVDRSAGIADQLRYDG